MALVIHPPIRETGILRLLGPRRTATSRILDWRAEAVRAVEPRTRRFLPGERAILIKVFKGERRAKPGLERVLCASVFGGVFRVAPRQRGHEASVALAVPDRHAETGRKQVTNQR